MRNRIVQATAAALLFASLAAPALAQDSDNNNGPDRGQAMKEEKKEEKEQKEEKKVEKKEEKENKENKGRVLSACLKAAAKAHVTAINAANKTRRDARNGAWSTNQQTRRDALKARNAAETAARAAFKASDKGLDAQIALETALFNAKIEWLKASVPLAGSLKDTYAAAQSAWKTAKEKADADLKAAQALCKSPVTPPVADTTAPAALTTLSLSAATSNSITLGWTAPGDDGATGTATSYDVRYSTTAIATEADFTAATQATGEPTPAAAGTAQTMTVSGLTGATTYFFAMKTKDEAANASALSNVPSLATLADTTAPSAVTTLSLSAATASSITLAWTATGDDGSTGTATSYDIRYSTTAIATEADFTAATQATGEPTPAVAGTAQTMTVSGLTASTTYYFAMKASDEVPNASALSNVVSLPTTAL